MEIRSKVEAQVGILIHWLAESLAYLGRSLSRDTVWGRKVRNVFPRLESDPEAKGRRKPKGDSPFSYECLKALCNLHRFSDLSRSRNELYLELVVGFASDSLVEQLGGSLEVIRSKWNWAPGSGFLNNEFTLSWRLDRNAFP